MAPVIVLAILAMPLLEIAAFIWLGGQIGVISTLAAIVLTAIAGIAIVRWQGMGLLVDSRAMMARGEMPALQFAEAMMLAIAGVMLVIPGFITDALGFALLIPAVRGALFAYLSRNMVVVPGYAPGQWSQTPKSIDLDTDDYR